VIPDGADEINCSGARWDARRTKATGLPHVSLGNDGCGPSFLLNLELSFQSSILRPDRYKIRGIPKQIINSTMTWW
jgi:hypothetical protein